MPLLLWLLLPPLLPLLILLPLHPVRLPLRSFSPPGWLLRPSPRFGMVSTWTAP